MVLCHCQFAASSPPSSSSAIRVDFVGSASDFIIFCVVYDLITRKIILLLYIHARTDARVCECSSVAQCNYNIYMTCGLYDSTQGEILEELRFRFRFHNTHTHTTESAFRGVVSLINRHTSLCR